ncbi:MAG: metallophosphoesterase [Planctomycetes bacterium]|nr:metallophosphoesterase [Planctomycetota bacterium]MCW8136655.1 metallophosphoesterase [Planctomycetota bacterium]
MIVFHIIGFLVTALNVLTFLALARRIRAAFPRRGRVLVGVAGAAALLLLHPGIFLMFGGISGLMAIRDGVPQWVAITGMSAQFAAWVYGGLLLIKATPALFIDLVRRLRRVAGSEKSGTQPEQQLADSQRRQFMAKAALSVPAAIVATAGGGALASRLAPRVTRLQLPVARDLTQLHGLKIAQVSDVHVGSYMDWDRLTEILEVMNTTGADYFVITGDLIDNHVEQLELSQRFINGMKPKRQVFMSMGNHEYIAARTADTPGIISGLKDTRATVLIDEFEKVNVGGAHLWLGAIDHPPQLTLPRLHDRDIRASLEHALHGVADDGAPRILLSHHPRTFNVIKDYPVDLTLSGHTHGGQMVAGRIGDYAMTPVLPFEFFHNGYYERNGKRLYVNSGAGGWMPVRINCPPEITVVELV